jgi:hypothetical protein
MDDHTIYLTGQVLMASDNDYILNHVLIHHLYKLWICCLLGISLESLLISDDTYAKWRYNVHLEEYRPLGLECQA